MRNPIENDTLISIKLENAVPTSMFKCAPKRSILSVLAVLFTASVGMSDTVTTAWTGNSSTAWTNSSNWANGIPGSSKSAVFNSTFANQPNYTSSSPGTSQGIWLAAGVGQDVTLTMNNPMNITGTATLGNQTNAGFLLDDPANHSFSINNAYQMSIVNTTGFYVNNAGTLTLAGAASINGNGKTLTLGGTNRLGQINISRQIGQNPDTIAVVVNTAGIVTIGRIGGNTSYYSGGLTLTSGTLNLNSSDAPGRGTLTINGGTIDNTTSAAITFVNNNPIMIGGNFTFTGTTNLNFGTGSVDLGGGIRTITVATNILTLGGAVTNGSITKAGEGRLLLSGVNTYTNTTVNAGTLEITKTNGLYETSSVSIANGAKMYLHFTGTNTVKYLKLGGNVTTKGIYGASDLGGTAFFTEGGSGKLNVTESGFPRGTLISVF